MLAVWWTRGWGLKAPRRDPLRFPAGTGEVAAEAELAGGDKRAQAQGMRKSYCGASNPAGTWGAGKNKAPAPPMISITTNPAITTVAV